MIKPKYLMHKPGGPSAPKRFLDQSVLPALVDTAGGIETIVERLAIRVRRSPGPSMGIAFGVGVLLSLLNPRQRSPGRAP